MRRAKRAAEKGIDYVDCGTSGGVFGLERGYCLMIGGPAAAVQRLAPIFETLAPRFDAARRTPGRNRGTPTARRGGPPPGEAGPGPFGKMGATATRTRPLA